MLEWKMNSEGLIGLCLERDVIKCTWERGTAVDRALMDYLPISRNARNRILDIYVYRGPARGMSDHYLVEGTVRVAERRLKGTGLMK